MVTSSFKNVFKKIERNVTTATNQAMSRAASSSKAFYAKETSAELGLPSAKVKARAKVFKPTESRPQMSLSIGVRNQFAAQDFKTSEKRVKTRIGSRWNAAFQVKGREKVFIPGAFLATANNASATKKLVLQRVGDARYPTKTVMVDVFRPTVEKLVPTIQRHMIETFNKNFNSQLKYNLSK